MVPLAIALAWPGAAAAKKSWHIRDGHLFAELDVLAGFDSDGGLVAMKNAKAIWLDIGINTRPTEMPGKNFGALGVNATYYLGFEPLIDKWAANVGRNVAFGQFVQLGTAGVPGARIRDESTLMVPIAVADMDDQPATFTVSNIDGCSTLNTPRDTNAMKGWQSGMSACNTVRERRTVPTISLKTVLQSWLYGRVVEFLHVDVQGAELSVLRSGGDLRQVQRLLLEVPNPSCATLTVGAPSCQEVVDFATQSGFVTEAAICTNTRRAPYAPGLRRGFKCSDIPWDFSTMCKCEVDLLLTRPQAQR